MKVNKEYQTWKPIALYILYIFGLLFLDGVVVTPTIAIILSIIWTIVVIITGIIDYKKYHSDEAETCEDNTINLTKKGS